jgi:hypothetical protein
MQNQKGHPPSPSFRAVTEIAQYAGRGRTVGHFATVRFPGGAVQVWALTPHTRAAAPDADASAVVAVFLKGRGIDRWKPLDQGFEEAVAHYQRLAAAAARRRADAATRTPDAAAADRAAAA